MRIFICLGIIALLSGCMETPLMPRPPEMTFDQYKKIELNVAAVEVRNNYKPPLRDPNIEHRFPTPPYVAIETLLKKQLVAAGNENILRVTIDDASVVQEELMITKGLMNALTREESERLKAKALLRFELIDPKAPDIVIGHAEVIAKRDKTLLEGTSVADRDRAYFALTEDMMDDISDGLMSVVKNTFGKKP